MVAERGAAWRINASVEQKKRTKAYEQEAGDAKEYIFALEGELQKTCAGILSMGEPKVPYYKAKTIEQRASKLDGSCAAQAPEWEELQRLRAEGLVAIRVTNKFLNDCDEVIPKWFNVVEGVVDSEDLPLNIHCQNLLQNKILRVIKKKRVTKYLEILGENAELNDDYKKSYEQYGKRLKLGNDEDSTVGVKSAEVLKFNTSKPGGEQNSFKEYENHMSQEQNDVHYITGESIVMVSSPFEENLRKKDLEELHVADPMDEYAIHQPKEFDGKMLKSTTKEGFDLGDGDEKRMLEELKAEFESLAELMKGVPGDEVRRQNSRLFARPQGTVCPLTWNAS